MPAPSTSSLRTLGLALGFANLAVAAGCRADAAEPQGQPDPWGDVEGLGAYPQQVFHEHMGEASAARWLPGDGVLVRDGLDAEVSTITIEADAGGSVRALPLHDPPFERADRAKLHVRVAEATPADPLEIELAFYDDTSGNRWWKALVIDEPGWHELEVPLSYLRYDRGALPRWENVGSWGMTFRTAGTLEIGEFELLQDGPFASPYLTVDELRAAFPRPNEVLVHERGPFVLLTDEPELESEAVLEALMGMYVRTYRRFPSLPEPRGSVPLLVFASDSDYRSFWDRVSEAYGSSVQPHAEDEGYTWQGVAATTFSRGYGAVRPIYVHEASHALLERSLGLAAQRSWLFEGLGIVEQLEVSKQELADVYRMGLARADVKMPLFAMISGEPIPTSRYWQAVLLMEWILADPGRTAALDAAMLEMSRRGSVDLRPLLEANFNLDLPRLSASFWAWAWATYARGPGT